MKDGTITMAAGIVDGKNLLCLYHKDNQLGTVKEMLLVNLKTFRTKKC